MGQQVWKKFADFPLPKICLSSFVFQLDTSDVDKHGLKKVL